jgi:hypothetical protein
MRAMMAGRFASKRRDSWDGSGRSRPFSRTLRQAEREGHLTDDRYMFLRTLIEWIRVTPPDTDKLQNAHLTTPGVAH